MRYTYTAESLNNGHIGTSHLSIIERLSSLWRSKCTSIIEKGPQCPLLRGCPLYGGQNVLV